MLLQKKEKSLGPIRDVFNRGLLDIRTSKRFARLGPPYRSNVDLKFEMLKGTYYPLIIFLESAQTFCLLAPTKLAVGKNSAVSHSEGAINKNRDCN